MSDTDWDAWRKCPVCHAETGDPCMGLTGRIVHGRSVDQVEVALRAPHHTRPARTGTRRDT